MAAELLDPYATLGVARSATIAQITRAYHRLAKELHPDLRGDASSARMRVVNAAWEILSDPRKRAAWDLGQPVVAAGSHWSPRTGVMGTTTAQHWAEWPADRTPSMDPSHPRPGQE